MGPTTQREPGRHNVSQRVFVEPGPYDRTVRYLSSEWIAASNEAVQSAAASAPAEPLVIDQHVEGVIRYRVRIQTGSCSITELSRGSDGPAHGPDGDSAAETADATFAQDLETARAVASGRTDAHQAFLLGRIAFSGDADLLIERRDAFAWLAETLAPVMARTDFD